MASIGDIVAHLKLDMSNFTNNLKTAVNEVKNSTNKFDSMTKAGEKLSNVGKSLSTKLTAPIVALGAGVIKTGSDFEAAMSKVQAISGASASDMKKLEAAAREMGSTTQFSARESADALGYMALAGWDTQQSIDALPGILNLAAASGMGLAEASDLCTDYMSAFGMKANEAGRMADVLAYAQGHSNTTTAQLGEAFKNCAVNANAFGMDVEQTTAVLGKLADQGLKGSEAGTALNAVIRDMSSKMKDGAIQIGNTSVKITDANGNFRSMSDIVRDVNKATDGMSESEKMAALQTTFTADSIKAMGILCSTGADNIDELTDALYNSEGEAARVADTMNNNLQGSLKKLKSALEETAISFYKLGDGPIKSLIDWLTKLVEKFNKLPDSAKQWIMLGATIVAAIGPVLLIIGNLITAVSTIGSAFSTVANVAKFVFGGALMNLVDTAMTAAYVFITDSLIPALGALWAFMLANPITFVIAAIMALVAAFIYLWNNCEGFRNFWINLWENIKTFCFNACSNIMNLITTWGENISMFFQTLPERWNALCEWFTQLPGRIWEWLCQATAKVGEWIVEMAQKAMEAGMQFVQGVITTLTELPLQVWWLLCFVVSYVVLWIAQMVEKAIEAGTQFVENVINFIKELPSKVWNWLVNTYNRVVQWVSQMIQKAQEMGSQFLQAVIQFFTQLPGRVWNFLVNTINRASQWVSQMIQKAQQAGSQFVQNVINFIQQLPGRVWNWLSNTYQRAVSWVTQMGQAGMNAARQLVTNCVNGLKGLPSKMASVGRNIVQGVINGVTSAASSLYNTLKNLAMNALNAAKAALGIQSPSRKFRDLIGKFIPEGIAVGVDANTSEAIQSVQDMTKKMLDAANISTMIDSIKTKTQDNIINNNSNILTSIADKFKDINTQAQGAGTININLNIDNFNNQRATDVKQLMTEITDVVRNSKMVSNGKRG